MGIAPFFPSMGNAELETLLAADEEARARIDASRADARKTLDGARTAVADARAARMEALGAELEREIEAIRAEAERAALDRRRRRTAFLEQKRRDTDLVLSHAAEAYARIVRDGPPADDGKPRGAA